MTEYTRETRRLTPPTIRVLDDDQVWTKRENSAMSILRILFIGAFVVAFVVLILTLTILGALSLILEAGYRAYLVAAPFALLALLGYLIGRGKRHEQY